MSIEFLIEDTILRKKEFTLHEIEEEVLYKLYGNKINGLVREVVSSYIDDGIVSVKSFKDDTYKLN